MKRVRIISHQEKAIIYCDFTNLTMFPRFVIKELMDQVRELIGNQPSGSVLIFTNLTGIFYDASIIALFKEYFAYNKPYIKASAVIGFPAELNNVREAIQKETEREAHSFEREDDALDWLVTQSFE